MKKITKGQILMVVAGFLFLITGALSSYYEKEYKEAAKALYADPNMVEVVKLNTAIEEIFVAQFLLGMYPEGGKKGVFSLKSAEVFVNDVIKHVGDMSDIDDRLKKVLDSLSAGIKNEQELKALSDELDDIADEIAKIRSEFLGKVPYQLKAESKRLSKVSNVFGYSCGFLLAVFAGLVTWQVILWARKRTVGKYVTKEDF